MCRILFGGRVVRVRGVGVVLPGVDGDGGVGRGGLRGLSGRVGADLKFTRIFAGYMNISNMGTISFDEKAFEALFRGQFERLMGFVCGYVGDEETAKDIVHDAFLALWNNRERLDPGLSVRSYLFAIAQRQALNWVRHRRVEEMNTGEVARVMEEAAEGKEDEEKMYGRLDEKLLELPEQQRKVLMRCVVDGKKYKEVAEELGITLNTVKTHLTRALAFLRGELSEEVVLFFYVRYRK